MNFAIYNPTNGKIFGGRYYPTERGAKIALTRLNKKGEAIGYMVGDPLMVSLSNTKVTRVNLMTGAEYQEDINTPLCCSPASESYWSM